jgi:hypothetical protein
MEQSTGEAFYAQEREVVIAEVPHITEVTESGNGQPPRVVGSPLAMGAGASSPLNSAEPKRLTSVPPPGRAMTNQPDRTHASDQPSGLTRAVNLIRMAIPYFQKILPLLDGNIVTTVSNILTPPPPPPPPAPTVDLAPFEKGLAEMQAQHRELREQFVEQNSSLKRVEDQLELVREATDRNTLEQQELLEDLKTVGNKVNLVAVVAIGLLGISVVINLLLYMHIQRVLP